MDPNATGVLSGEQPYSLRERVTQLENVVRNILQRIDEEPRSSSSPEQEKIEIPTGNLISDVSRERHLLTVTAAQEETKVLSINSKSADTVLASHQHIENAPVLQLFNNNVVSRTEGLTTRSQDAAAIKDLSPKAVAARSRLLTLVLPRADIMQIRNGAAQWWTAWHYMFPEITDACRDSLTSETEKFCEIPSSPGEIAKFVICTLMSIEQLPQTFDYAALQVPLNPKEYTERCLEEIDRLIVQDDDLASTLPGLEAIIILCKWYNNWGRPRKAWLLNRRAIELAQLSGIHMSTARPPHPSDTLYNRRLKLWTSLALSDRFLGLILGLPYSIQDNFLRPQVEMRLKNEKPNLESYALRLSLIMGPLIDRNQEDPAKMSLAATLKIEQDLESHARAMPPDFWEVPGPGCSPEESNDRLVTHFMHHFTRALIHLPFMLRSHSDRRYQYSHDAALESSRTTLLSYNGLRSWSGINPYICRVLDFQVFTVAMLLIIHLLGYSEDSPNYSQVQDDKDWALVDATTEVLRQVAAEPAGTVAAQSLHILDSITKSVPNFDPQNACDMSCKITVPYFGVVTVSPGKKMFSARQKRTRSRPVTGPGLSQTSSEQTSPAQLYTPPQSIPGDCSAMGSDRTSSTTWTPPFMDDSRIQFENMVAFPNSGLVDPNLFSGFTDEQSLGMWSNLNLDLDLDQGWNLNWHDDGNAVIP